MQIETMPVTRLMIRNSPSYVGFMLWKRLRWALIGLTLALVTANGLALMHAWRFTHFSLQSSARTPAPEELGSLEKVQVLLFGVSIPKPNGGEIGMEEHPLSTAVAWRQVGEGSGCAVLFHGYGATAESLLEESEFFAGRGMSVVVVDFPGHGHGPGVETSIGWHEALVVAEASALCEGDRPLVLYGQSMGAAAVLRASSELGVPADALILEGVFRSFLGTVENRFETVGLPSEPAAAMLVFWGSLMLGFNGFAHEPEAYALGVQSRTLLLHGEVDPRVHLEDAAMVAEAVPGGAQLVTFEGAGHVSLYAWDKPKWEATVDGFLRDIQPAGDQ